MSALAGYVLVPTLRRQVVRKRVGLMRPALLDGIMELVTHIASTGRDLHATRVADIREFSLPALLRFEDRNSMAHSIEARVPFVDREVVSCSLRLPDDQLLQDGYTKYPLRLLAATLLPDAITWRRAKVGFEPPSRQWLAALREQMQREVEASSLIARLTGAPPHVATQPLPLQWRLYNLARWQSLFEVEAA
jgi:asparagine synthase (glutamine-hydrolysing)